MKTTDPYQQALYSLIDHGIDHLINHTRDEIKSLLPTDQFEALVAGMIKNDMSFKDGKAASPVPTYTNKHGVTFKVGDWVTSIDLPIPKQILSFEEAYSAVWVYVDDSGVHHNIVNLKLAEEPGQPEPYRKTLIAASAIEQLVEKYEQTNMHGVVRDLKELLK